MKNAKLFIVLIVVGGAYLIFTSGCKKISTTTRAERHDQVDSQLDRIEDKLDTLIEEQNKPEPPMPVDHFWTTPHVSNYPKGNTMKNEREHGM